MLAQHLIDLDDRGDRGILMNPADFHTIEAAEVIGFLKHGPGRYVHRVAKSWIDRYTAAEGAQIFVILEWQLAHHLDIHQSGAVKIDVVLRIGDAH